MFIYRIENKVGRGPYRKKHDGNDCNVNLESTMCYSRKHPIPYFDGIDISQETEVCGFKSLDQLIEWFDGYIEELESDRFFISIYKVKKKYVKFGGRQVCFVKGRALLVGHVNGDVTPLVKT